MFRTQLVALKIVLIFYAIKTLEIKYRTIHKNKENILRQKSYLHEIERQIHITQRARSANIGTRMFSTTESGPAPARPAPAGPTAN